MSARLIRVRGHFGELLQGRLGPEGPLGLVNLPSWASYVELRADADNEGVEMSPAGLIPLDWPARLAGVLGCDWPEARIYLRASVQTGLGAGISTAALTAIGRYLKPSLAASALAQACIEVEGASDPLMYPRPAELLWASRRGRIIDHLPPLPPIHILGGFLGEAQQTNPEDQRFADIRDLIPKWKVACRAGDISSIGAICSESARRSMELRGPDPAPLLSLAKTIGASGFFIAYTGAIRGFLFPRGAMPPRAPAALLAYGFRGVIAFEAGGSA